MNTLRYAERARSISNSIKRNVVQAMPTAAEFAAMQAEIRRLKVENSKLKNRVAAEISKDVAGSLLDQEDEPPQQVAVQTPSSIHQATPIVGSVPQEIFRLPPPSQSIQSDSSKSRKPTPVWMHFKTLAKYSGDVSSYLFLQTMCCC